MPSMSAAQQHTAGMALAVKRGEKKLSDLPTGARKPVSSMIQMKEGSLTEFARSKTSPKAKAKTMQTAKSRKIRSY